jgi:hypothetical protein
MSEEKETIFCSFDVEADGPSPFENSMLSLGIVFFKENKTILGMKEWKLYPLKGHKTESDTMEFWSKFPDAYKHSTSEQVDFVEAFKEFAKEINDYKKKYTIIPVACPAAYDWQWINYYFSASGISNPLGYSAFCISTFLKSINPTKSIMYDEKFNETFKDPNYPHTHKPLEDALEEGMKFLNALKWHKEQK